MATIKNIIFDLGGVLLNIDYNKTISAFKELGIENFEEMFSQFHVDKLFEKLETGRISENDFYETVKKRIPGPVSNDQVETAWNAMILDFRKESLAYLEKLSGNYALFLLSNTNSIHLKHFQQVFTRETGQPSLDKYFTTCWYSNIIGLRKPNKEVYEYVLKDKNLNAAETFFVDDTIDNIRAAMELGIKSHLVLPHERIENIQF